MKYMDVGVLVDREGASNVMAVCIYKVFKRRTVETGRELVRTNETDCVPKRE